MIENKNYGEAISFYLTALILDGMKQYKSARKYYELAHNLSPDLF